MSFSSVQSLSRVRLFATPWIAAHQASLSTTNSRSSLKLTSIESVMPPSHLILCCPLLLLSPITPRIRVFSNESTLRMRWPKYWSFSFGIITSKEHPRMISFIFYFIYLFIFIFKLYKIVLVLPNIKMNPPQVYMCSPSWTLLPPPSPYHPSGLSQCTSPKHPVSCIESGLATHTWYFTCFNAILPNLPTLSLSHRVHKTVQYISVPFANSYTGLLLPSF